MTRDLKFEVVYPYPPERVWRAITDSRALAEWLMENSFEPRVGHKFQFRTDPAPGFDGIVHCEVLEVERPRRLSYSWKGGPLDTVVTWTLESLPEGTRLRLDHKGFRGLRGLMVSFILGGGWKKKLLREKLPQYLARMGAEN